MAAIITPHCSLFAASLARPVGGFYVLAVTFHETTAIAVSEILRTTMVSEYGVIGRNARLPLTDLEDGRWLMRFVSRHVPPVCNAVGLELIVQPARGTILRVDAELQPMRSHVGIIPIMRKIVVFQLAATPDASNAGASG